MSAEVFPVYCGGPGPHDPADGLLGESDTDTDLGMLCPPCADKANATVEDAPSLVTVQVDPDAVTAALTAAGKATTVKALGAAVVALGQQLQP